MEYIVNEIPIKTTNSFNLNNLKINLDLPSNLSFHDYIINNINYSCYERNDFSSKVGLNFPKYLNLDLTINDNIEEPIEIIYEFNKNDTLVDNINIKYLKNSKRNIIIKYQSMDNGSHFHHLKLNIDMDDNSIGNITIINMLNDNSINIFAKELVLNSKSNLNLNVIDLGGKIKINNIESNTNLLATSNLNNIYIGVKDDILDMNYNYINNGKESNNNLVVEGLLNDNAKKKFRGTINFIKGSSNAIGKESENVICLSDNVINSSVPILLCGEENVSGSHSVSSSKIDDQQLFYLLSKGIQEKDAKKMIVLGNFSRIINKIYNQKYEDEIIKYIENSIFD